MARGLVLTVAFLLAAGTYNTGFLLSKGQYRLKRGEHLDAEKYPELVKRFEGWENYATLIGDFLREAGMASPVATAASGEADLTVKSEAVSEAAMTEAATTPGTVHGKLYEQGLQKREFVYAAYNNGEFADVIRLSREMMDICERLKQQRAAK